MSRCQSSLEQVEVEFHDLPDYIKCSKFFTAVFRTGKAVQLTKSVPESGGGLRPSGLSPLVEKPLGLEE